MTKLVNITPLRRSDNNTANMHLALSNSSGSESANVYPSFNIPSSSDTQSYNAYLGNLSDYDTLYAEYRSLFPPHEIAEAAQQLNLSSSPFSSSSSFWDIPGPAIDINFGTLDGANDCPPSSSSSGGYTDIDPLTGELVSLPSDPEEIEKLLAAFAEFMGLSHSSSSTSLGSSGLGLGVSAAGAVVGGQTPESSNENSPAPMGYCELPGFGDGVPEAGVSMSV